MMDQQTEFDYSQLYGNAPEQKQQSAQEAGPQYADGAANAGKEERRRAERELQEELEQQLRGLGESVTEGFRHGFEGRGPELEQRAKGFGSAIWNVVDYGLGQGAEQLRDAAQQLRQQRNRRAEAYTGGAQSRSGSAGARADWWNGKKSALLSRANTRFGFGLAQTIVGGVLSFGLLLAGLICIVAAPYTGTAFGSEITGVVGACLFAGGLPFVWLTGHGAGNLGASKRIRAYAEAIGDSTHISVRTLAEAVQRPVKKVRKDLRRLLSKGWMTGYLDAQGQTLYLSAEEWRAAQEQAEEASARLQAEPAAESAPVRPQTEDTETEVTPEAIERFIAVLGSEQKLMRDPVAVEELERMQTVSRSICEWVRTHPESAGKARRFVTYYMPTTLKLLHTYNEVEDRQGENAEAIRRDIGGILHTLNMAFENLHDSLLSDMAMDVSSEIAALQGMLAQDGLAQDGAQFS